MEKTEKKLIANLLNTVYDAVYEETHGSSVHISENISLETINRIAKALDIDLGEYDSVIDTKSLPSIKKEKEINPINMIKGLLRGNGNKIECSYNSNDGLYEIFKVFIDEYNEIEVKYRYTTDEYYQKGTERETYIVNAFNYSSRRNLDAQLLEFAKYLQSIVKNKDWEKANDDAFNAWIGEQKKANYNKHINNPIHHSHGGTIASKEEVKKIIEFLNTQPNREIEISNLTRFADDRAKNYINSPIKMSYTEGSYYDGMFMDHGALQIKNNKNQEVSIGWWGFEAEDVREKIEEVLKHINSLK